MDYENYMELYEAVYLFSKINCHTGYKLPLVLNDEENKRLGINESIYSAIMKILVVNNLLSYNGDCYVLTAENQEKQRHMLDNIISKKISHYTQFYNKAVDKSRFFFDSISDLEYEIYSRCNFEVNTNIGNEVAKHLNLASSKVLELGGNSGGLGTALLATNKNCSYTVVDTKIPCIVGRELKQTNNTDITFIEGNVFDLKLPNQIYDYIIIMNLLHDFDDTKCLDILRNCTRYMESKTKFIIIEDTLTSQFEPKEVIMHGLRLSVECRGGKQRTVDELASLFLNIDYKPEKIIRINSIHTMTVMGQI